MSFTLCDSATEALETDGSVLILGGPGSGKTTLSLLKAQRIAPRLAPGQSILFLSFSRAAVHQVIVRCEDVLSAEERDLIEVKTYHAFCMELLRAHGQLISGSRPRVLFPRQERLQQAAYEGDWSVEQERLADEDGVYAFDQFARCSSLLLQRRPCVRELVTSRYPVIILDEFQDTNDAQWAMVQLLSEHSELIFLADPDQRIFEYQDEVDPRRLDQLRETLDPTKFDLGTINHRSPQGGILSFADAVLRNRRLPEVPEVACRVASPNQTPAQTHAEAFWLLSRLRKDGVEDPCIAILCRSNLFLLDLSAALNRESRSRDRIYRPLEHQVVWDSELSSAAAAVVAGILEWPQHDPQVAAGLTLDAVADYFDVKLTSSKRPSKSAKNSAMTFRRAAEAVRSGRTPRSKAGKLIANATTTGIQLSGSPVEDWKLAQSLLSGQGDLVEVERMSQMVRLLRASGIIGPSLADTWTTSGNYGHARRIVCDAIDQAMLLSSRTEPRGVMLMTIHKSKGKEFDGVILVEGFHRSSFLNVRRERPPYEESRRLIRVGITRARKRVVILKSPSGLPLVGDYN